MNTASAALRILLLAMAVCMCSAPVALAESFPSRPIHLILPYAPGGIIEFAGRTLAQKLGEVLGQPVVVEDRPGAGSVVGVDYVARAAPDGYTIVLVDPGLVTNPTLHKSLPYDIFKKLVAISIVVTAPEVLVVGPQLGINTHAALLAYGDRPASAVCHISPPSYGRRGPVSMPHMSLTRASVRPSST
jgi:tripartite-type tricarboxylate transporter receptor subunit TctC